MITSGLTNSLTNYYISATVTNMTKQAKRYYTADETAEILDKNGSTIRRWCRQGLMDGAKKAGLPVRSPWLIPVETVETVKIQIGAE
jgi:hypothetical protein